MTRNILSALQAKFRGSAFRAADYPTNSLKRAQNQSAFGVPQRSGQGSQCEWKPVVQVWIPKEKRCVIHSDHPYNAPMAMGRRKQQRRQEEFWIAHTELPRTAAHPFYEQLNSFVLHSLAFLLKPHCEAAADSDQLRLSFFHCSAPILCRSSLCVPRYRTIRSPAVLPGSIGVEHGDCLVCLPAAFCPRDTLLPKFPSLGLQLRDVSLQTVVGWKPESRTSRLS